VRREEGKRKKEEGRRKKEEGRRKKQGYLHLGCCLLHNLFFILF
jgi:hypothetical protein